MKDLMREHNINQNQLSLLLGVSRAFIFRVKNGDRPLPTLQQEKIKTINRYLTIIQGKPADVHLLKYEFDHYISSIGGTIPNNIKRKYDL